MVYEVNKTDNKDANLIYTLLLSTKEAKILYSMILHSKRQGKREDEMLKLKIKLGISESITNVMQIVNNAVEEINRKTPVHVSIEVKENNNKEIEKVIFIIADRKGFKKPDIVVKEKKPEPKKYLEKTIENKSKTKKKKGN